MFKLWISKSYNSYFLIHDCGVSILIYKKAVFKELNYLTDSHGGYMVLYCLIQGIELVIVGVYLPPAASPEILVKIKDEIKAGTNKLGFRLNSLKSLVRLEHEPNTLIL